jgi:hypothetical protein
MKPLLCPHCDRGNLYLDNVVPGLFDVVCLLCSRIIGEILADDLTETFGIPPEKVRWAEQSPLTFLWAREVA